MSQQAYPLAWPIGRPRWSGQRVHSMFKMTDGQMKDHLYSELDRLEYLDGSIDIAVTPQNAKDDRYPKAEYINAHRLELVGDGVALGTQRPPMGFQFPETSA